MFTTGFKMIQPVQITQEIVRIIHFRYYFKWECSVKQSSCSVKYTSFKPKLVNYSLSTTTSQLQLVNFSFSVNWVNWSHIPVIKQTISQPVSVWSTTVVEICQYAKSKNIFNKKSHDHKFNYFSQIIPDEILQEYLFFYRILFYWEYLKLLQQKYQCWCKYSCSM